MKVPTQKKIAREVLILFGSIVLTLLVAIVLWCYSLVINNKIGSKNKIIKTHQNELSNISKVYSDKISKIKTFIGLLKQKEDEHWGSSFTLYLASKEMNVDKAVKKYQADQAINGKLPQSRDTVFYYNCLQPLKNIKLPKGAILTNFPDSDALTVWDCLLKQKENLFYFLPLSFLEEYKIETRNQLFDLIQQYNLNNDELKTAKQIDTLDTQIAQLQKEKNILSVKAINKQDLFRIALTTLIIILIIVYPIRLMYITFRWALKTYRK